MLADREDHFSPRPSGDSASVHNGPGFAGIRLVRLRLHLSSGASYRVPTVDDQILEKCPGLGNIPTANVRHRAPVHGRIKRRRLPPGVVIDSTRYQYRQDAFLTPQYPLCCGQPGLSGSGGVAAAGSKLWNQPQWCADVHLRESSLRFPS